MVSFALHYIGGGGGGALTFEGRILSRLPSKCKKGRLITFEGRLLLRLTRLFTRYVVNYNLYCLPPSP